MKYTTKLITTIIGTTVIVIFLTAFFTQAQVEQISTSEFMKDETLSTSDLTNAYIGIIEKYNISISLSEPIEINSFVREKISEMLNVPKEQTAPKEVIDGLAIEGGLNAKEKELFDFIMNGKTPTFN